MAKCNTATLVQSPITIFNMFVSSATGQSKFTTSAKEWAPYAYSFLPYYTATTVPADSYGYTNYVFQMNATFGTTFAAEPLSSTVSSQIEWQASNIRFHAPGEHQFNTTSYDMEM